MLAKVTKLSRYRVVVLSMKPKRGFLPPEDGIFVNELDTFFGYSYPNHRVGKYIDLWFTPIKEDDLENFVTFGRIIRMEPFRQGHVYVTKLGRFYVERK